MHSETYWGRLFGALLGHAPSPPETFWAPAAAELEARIRSLQMDIDDRDRRIEQMRSEYNALQSNRDRAVAEAGQEQLVRLFKRLAGTLSNLAALTALQEAGRDVSPADFAALARSLERELGKAGLERIGAAGETAAFDIGLHQRMSGAAVRDGSPVTVRIPGYRAGTQILLKAMVSSAEDVHA
jgi:molecular chaperone GrpE (heat shock protein)